MAQYSGKKVRFIMGEDEYTVDPLIDVSEAIAEKADRSEIPTKVSQLTNDSGFTSNQGTITGIVMNGQSKGTSGVVNLGTIPDASVFVNKAGDTMTGDLTVKQIRVFTGNSNNCGIRLFANDMSTQRAYLFGGTDGGGLKIWDSGSHYFQIDCSGGETLRIHTLDGNGNYLAYTFGRTSGALSVPGKVISGGNVVAPNAEISGLNFNNFVTPVLISGANVGTQKNGATLNTNESYTRALKRCGFAWVHIRLTCPSISSGSNKIVLTLADQLIPYADVAYIKAYDMWDPSVAGTVSIASDGIHAYDSCSGKDILIMATYPTRN